MNFPRLVFSCIFVAIPVCFTQVSGAPGNTTTQFATRWAAAALRGGGEGVNAWVSFDEVKTDWPILAEVENFTVAPSSLLEAPPAFTVTTWGHDHYYGATFSNTFASRGALLHSTANSVGKATSKPIAIPAPGVWYACVRYEAAYHFETEFTLTVRQGGATRLHKLYGQRASPKIWAFGYNLIERAIAGCGANPTPECRWTWGATENWVWEYYPVTLSAGSVTFEVSVTNSTSRPGLAPLADRNIDVVLLTQNLTDIEMRSANEQQLALDGLFSQHDEVFVKVTNHAAQDMELNVPASAYHSAYPSQHLICIPYCKVSSNGKVYSSVARYRIPVAKHSTTPQWVEVGSRMDSFNYGTWTFSALTPLKSPQLVPAYSMVFGLKEPRWRKRRGISMCWV